MLFIACVLRFMGGVEYSLSFLSTDKSDEHTLKL